MESLQNQQRRSYGSYVVLYSGRVLVAATGQPAITDYDRRGHLTFFNSDRGGSQRVDRVVARVFMGYPPPGHVLGHRDGNRRNCAVSNLYWLSRQQAADDALVALPPSHRRFRIGVRVSRDGELVGEYESLSQCAEALGLNVNYVSKVLNGKIISTKGLTFIKASNKENGTNSSTVTEDSRATT